MNIIQNEFNEGYIYSDAHYEHNANATDMIYIYMWRRIMVM